MKKNNINSNKIRNIHQETAIKHKATVLKLMAKAYNMKNFSDTFIYVFYAYVSDCGGFNGIPFQENSGYNAKMHITREMKIVRSQNRFTDYTPDEMNSEFEYWVDLIPNQINKFSHFPNYLTDKVKTDDLKNVQTNT